MKSWILNKMWHALRQHILYVKVYEDETSGRTLINDAQAKSYLS